MKLETVCIDMKFKNATRSIVSRIFTEMSGYLEQQPVWEAATLQLLNENTNHEVLLFADQGPAGSFTGVPNVMRAGNFLPVKDPVPLLKFQLKLLQQGKFLLMVDCHIGGASLAARFDTIPYRSEIQATVATLGLGDGFPACVKDKNKGEEFFLIERFSSELTDLDPPVDWNRSVLFMESSADMSALFISTNVSGKFIRHFKVHDFGMKLVYPGYLGILNCKYRVGYAAAPLETKINASDVEEIASRLGIRGEYNSSGIEDLETPDLDSFKDDEDLDSYVDNEVENYIDVDD
ncbi:unnamed protein product [Leptidea sinapis]|uniref:Uncharacterized protein n=1 Tax=Leptidea sinapis TaxID=189913 RepID=A0A5E4Q484_9NEOP|nr:unnamed protein product [Leptidea sinapis]